MDTSPQQALISGKHMHTIEIIQFSISYIAGIKTTLYGVEESEVTGVLLSCGMIHTCWVFVLNIRPVPLDIYRVRDWTLPNWTVFIYTTTQKACNHLYYSWKKIKNKTAMRIIFLCALVHSDRRIIFPVETARGEAAPWFIEEEDPMFF